MDTIPIDDLVMHAKSDFVNWITTKATTALAIAVPWLSPVIFIVSFFLKIAITWLVDKGELGAFILNAKVLTSDQAKDYREAVAKRILAPEDIPDDQWMEIEYEANHQFTNLVRFAA